MLDRTFSVAPMLDWTDRHYRYFARLLSRHALLYTEMVTTGAIIHGKADYLAFDEAEHPLALQLGGSHPGELAHCARLAEERGYDEVNINVGCPSDRVQNGRFGACLMGEPELVAQSVAAMGEAVAIPVTVKTRIGIDELDSYDFLCDFVDKVSAGGCDTFIIHARKAWLQGLSPKENREIPPLDYERVYRLKQDFPHLHIGINGGIKTVAEMQQHLAHVDSVMVGREAYQNPYLLAEIDQALYDAEHAPVSRFEVVRQMLPYVERQMSQGARLNHISRHILGLFNGMPGGRKWRRYLSENAHKPEAGPHTLEAALALVQAG
ncbi:tRNA dihydrouridine(20/20a) synthase DusA [Gallaecimonas sp. GXIMD4217]|uniref:tRNA dihydrouridine(20/20a) synthase DusA n=1 Tax=Gallaecimonas sp. GXIMD4217 TaxID=3131927 RepID=UPI00311B089A